MFTKLALMLGKRRSDERRFSARIPSGQRVYAIGDIHGRSDLLKDLLAQIVADARGFKGSITLVCLGDYIDRGPDSKGVVDVLLTDIPTKWTKVFLRGNHEQALLDFVENPALRPEWLAWGGLQAMESYTISAYGPRGPRPSSALSAEFEQAMKDCGHDTFYRGTELYHVCGDYLFVHAGVRRGIPVEKQMAHDLLFIREDFIGQPHGLPYRVVFGHTILQEPLLEDDRIGLDTGAFQSGTLTAVRLEGDMVTVLRTGHQTGPRPQPITNKE